MKETIILTNFEFSSTIIGKVSHLSGGFSGSVLVRGPAELFRERGFLEKSAADTHGLFEWRMLADVFQSFPPRKFRQSAADPP